MVLPRVNASRYITSLREGGSLPALVEADDGRRYVVKLRGAGQGPLALVAEVVTGELARALELPVPRLALVELDPAFAKNEPDAEIQDLFRASAGLNVGLEFLPEATAFDIAAGDTLPAEQAARIVWLDAFTFNVDRTPRNPNLLCWQAQTWLIDHGASLYFHHNWGTAAGKSQASFPQIADHVLLPFMADGAAAAARFAHERLSPALLAEILDLVPAAWLVDPGDPRVPTVLGDSRDPAHSPIPEQRRAAYLQLLSARLQDGRAFEEEIARARPV